MICSGVCRLLIILDLPAFVAYQSQILTFGPVSFQGVTSSATRLVFDGQGHFTGRFGGEPCWGSEKLRRVRHVVGSLEDSKVVVYGNEKGMPRCWRRPTCPY